MRRVCGGHRRQTCACACIAPPPLDVPLAVEPAQPTDTWLLRDGDRVVASGVPAKLELEVPGAPPYVQAVWASQHYAGFKEHPFPIASSAARTAGAATACGFSRGCSTRTSSRRPWLPADDLDGGDGKVAVEFHWAALDCPGYFALGTPRRMLLGEMQAHVDRRVRVGEACTVIGWKMGSERRKHYSGTAIFDEDGELCARARLTWVDVGD